MIRHASLASGKPTAFEQKGTVRDARGWPDDMQRRAWTAYCTFISPTTPSAMRDPARGARICPSISPPSECGSTQAESPECTPASSTCCMIPPIHTSVPSHSASTSTSIAFSRKRSRKIAAVARVPALAAQGSRPGRRASRRSPSRGRPARRWGARAAEADLSLLERLVDRVRRGVRRRPGRRAPPSSAPKRPRSSARSIASTLVPSSGTPAASRPAASFSGVWPPNWTITPSGCSTSITASTSSSVSGSKYRRSEVS